MSGFFEYVLRTGNDSNMILEMEIADEAAETARVNKDKLKLQSTGIILLRPIRHGKRCGLGIKRRNFVLVRNGITYRFSNSSQFSCLIKLC